jgi:hypothetical protein
LNPFRDIPLVPVAPSMRLVNFRIQQQLIAEEHAKGETVEMAYFRADDPPNRYRTYKLRPPAVEV